MVGSEKIGKIATFYSFKGGGGRSMALANVAWALASNGWNVLAIDWDLEAPGLHRYFHPFLADPEQVRSRGLVDRLWQYARAIGSSGEAPEETIERLSDCSDIVQHLALPHAARGKLGFIGSGRQDEEYTQKVGAFEWAAFYKRFAGGQYFDAFGRWARKSFDIVLIDSRTGVSDSAGVCTVQLPDLLVLTFVYNRQSIDGTAAVARSIHRQRTQLRRPIRFFPTPTRVEDKSEAAHARRHAVHRMRKLFNRSAEDLDRELRLNEIRHYPWCAFEEKLAVFEEDPAERGSLLQEMHGLASRLVDGDIGPVRVDGEEMARLWRRAAFTDPRLADLLIVRDQSLSEAAPVLTTWLEEALINDDDRTDWRSALAAACVEISQLHAGGAFGVEVEALSKGGVDLARRLAQKVGDPDADLTAELGRLLLVRANFLQAQARSDEALDALAEATTYFRKGDHANGLQLARALEWQAGVLQRTRAYETAISVWTDAGKTYDRLSENEPRRFEDVARTFIGLAASYSEIGAPSRAVEACRRAVEALDRAAAEGVAVVPSSWAAALVAYGRCLLEAGDLRDAEMAVARAAQHFEDKLESSQLRASMAEVFALQGEILKTQGHCEEALQVVERAIALLSSASSEAQRHGSLTAVPMGGTASRLHILRAELLLARGDHAGAAEVSGFALHHSGIADVGRFRLRLSEVLLLASMALEDARAVDEAAGQMYYEITRGSDDEIPERSRRALQAYVTWSSDRGRHPFPTLKPVVANRFIDSLSSREV